MSELVLVVRLWLHPETNIAEFEEFEREAGQIMKAHGGRIERAFRSESASDHSNQAFEIHFVSFPDEAAFASYQNDESTLALGTKRERLIVRSEIWRGSEMNYGF